MKVDGQKTRSPPCTLVESREEPRSYIVQSNIGGVYRRNRMNLVELPDGDACRNAPMKHDDYGELPTTNNQQNPVIYKFYFVYTHARTDARRTHAHTRTNEINLVYNGDVLMGNSLIRYTVQLSFPCPLCTKPD